MINIFKKIDFQKYIDTCKMLLLWVSYGLLRIITFFVSILFFWIIYPFRNKAYNYASSDFAKWYHPLFIASLFLTKYKNSGNWHVGPFRYKIKLKTKHFPNQIGEEKLIAKSFKQKLIYFYIAYCWCGLRNYMWNLHRLLTAQTWNEQRLFIIKKSTIKYYGIARNLMPQAKFIDETSTYHGNVGKYILYPNSGFEDKYCTIQGFKHIAFFDDKGKRKIQINWVKLKPISAIGTIFIFEFQFGWNLVNCTWLCHVKFIFKKYDNKAERDYLRNKTY